MGSKAYPKTTRLMIMADGGGSNASRSRLWKAGLQRLANITGSSYLLDATNPNQ
jgi:hypothetical protein